MWHIIKWAPLARGLLARLVLAFGQTDRSAGKKNVGICQKVALGAYPSPITEAKTLITS